MRLSNVSKKNKGTAECDKSTVYVILVLPNVTMELLNMNKKNNGTIEYVKSSSICSVGIA